MPLKVKIVSMSRGKKMVQEERKVDSKGQVVIPRAMRKALKIEPGSKVLFKLEGDKIILKRFFDAVAVFERIAKSGKSVSKIDPHSAYEEELAERHKRDLSGTNISKKKKTL
jgi:AbrB family looped-hinge helix DNA binding protein